MLVNPPEPNLDVGVTKLTEKCAGRPIGLSLSLDLEGTPPFEVVYLTRQEGNPHSESRTEKISGSRGTIEHKPNSAGKWVVMLTELSDKVYRGIDLKPKKFEFMQEVKPSVNAWFTQKNPSKDLCMDDSASFDVRLQGEGPWSLEYDIVHDKRRSKHSASGIEQNSFTISTGPLTSGGEYNIILTGVIDSQGCRESLQSEAHVSVRHQRPRAGFGPVERKRSISTLEGKTVELPLRLAGQPPWTIGYRREGTNEVHTMRTSNANDAIKVKEAGLYEIMHVADSVCPGVVDDAAKDFAITAIARPAVAIPETPLMTVDGADGKYDRAPVCEGAEDALDIFLKGRPPYKVKYRENIRPESGKNSMKEHELSVGLHSAQIKMDTAQAGQYEYNFLELGDYNYDHEAKKHKSFDGETNCLSTSFCCLCCSRKGLQLLSGREWGRCWCRVWNGRCYSNHTDWTTTFHSRPSIEVFRKTLKTSDNYLSEHRDAFACHTNPSQILNIWHVNTIDSAASQIIAIASALSIQVMAHRLPARVSISPSTTRQPSTLSKTALTTASERGSPTHFPASHLLMSSTPSKAKNEKPPSQAPYSAALPRPPGSLRSQACKTQPAHVVATSPQTATKQPWSAALPKSFTKCPLCAYPKAERAALTSTLAAKPRYSLNSAAANHRTSSRTRAARIQKQARNVALYSRRRRLLVRRRRSVSLRARRATYEVVAIRDRYCSFAKQGVEGAGVRGARLLQDA